MDERSITKVRLKNILKHETDSFVIDDAVNRMGLLTTHVYQFLRLWVLTLDEIPPITKDIFHMCFKALTTTSKRGAPSKGDNNSYYEKFVEFYDTVYSKLNYKIKISGLNLSGISAYTFTQMQTAVENNIKMHYQNHVRRFINKALKPRIDRKCKKAAKGEVQALRKQLYSELTMVKNDMFNNTLKSPEQYHDWIQTYRKLIVPDNFTVEDLYDNPQRYLKCMINISKELRSRGLSQFQFFPLRKNFVPAHITLDTKALIELFSGRNEDMKSIKTVKERIWGEIFKTNYKVFRRKHWVFDHIITTNGYDVSVIFVNKKCYAEHENRKAVRVQCLTTAKQLYKGKSDEEVKEIKTARETEKKIKQKLKREEAKARKAESKEKKVVYREFPYVEDLSSEQKKEIEENNVGVIDMGKTRIITMMNCKTGKIFEYSRKQYLYETKRLQLQAKRERLKTKLEIIPLETKLAECNSKACDINSFKDYIKKRNALLKQLTTKYSDLIFRKYNFRHYINKERTKSKLVDKVRNFIQPQSDKKFQPKGTKLQKPILVFGNWSANKNMKGMVSTPGIGIKRFIAKHLTSYDIDEFRTSILYNKTQDYCKNLYITKEGETKKIHSVLTYKMENKRTERINRDHNAVYNMRNILEQVLKNGEYPYNFRRSTKPEQIKAVRPPQCAVLAGLSKGVLHCGSV